MTTDPAPEQLRAEIADLENQISALEKQVIHPSKMRFRLAFGLGALIGRHGTLLVVEFAVIYLLVLFFKPGAWLLAGVIAVSSALLLNSLVLGLTTPNQAFRRIRALEAALKQKQAALRRYLKANRMNTGR